MVERFIEAQRRTHTTALQELKSGRKTTHWSWWEIPQIAGLGSSATSQKYAIKDLSEAYEFLDNNELRIYHSTTLGFSPSDISRGLRKSHKKKVQNKSDKNTNNNPNATTSYVASRMDESLNKLRYCPSAMAFSAEVIR